MARDDFPRPTAERLAKRAAYQCSRPECRAVTIGPSAESPSSVATIGRAAHITAASPGGPRYDDTLKPQERASIENGIWLCANCADLVDDDVERFPTALLQQWKTDHDISTENRLSNALRLGDVDRGQLDYSASQDRSRTQTRHE